MISFYWLCGFLICNVRVYDATLSEIRSSHAKSEKYSHSITNEMESMEESKMAESENDARRMAYRVRAVPRRERSKTASKPAMTRWNSFDFGADFAGKARGDGTRRDDAEMKERNHCEDCGVSFRYDTHYMKHCQKHHEFVKPYRCERCGKTFSHRRSMLSHVDTKHRDGKTLAPRITKRQPIPCDACGVTLDGWTSFERHAISKHAGVKMFRCPHCPKKFSRRRPLSNHVGYAHDEPKKLKCKFCKHLFERTDVLQEHARHCQRRQCEKLKGEHILDLKKKNWNGLRIRCDECGGTFESFNELRNHCKSEHPAVKLYPCDYCGQEFRQKVTLGRHVDVKHADKRGDIKEAKRYLKKRVYKCQYCEGEFVGKVEYENHGKRRHPGLSMFFCAECDKGYSSKNALWNHANEEHGDGSFKKSCGYCGKYYFKRFRLRSHERNCRIKADKLARLPLQYCHLCRKDLRIDKKGFKDHLSRHKKFDFCPICNDGFLKARNPNALKVHVRLRHPHFEHGERTTETLQMEADVKEEFGISDC